MNAMMKPEPQMIRYEAACKALAEAKAVDEVQDIRNKADAMRIYGMQAKNKKLEVDAAEIRIRAERRLGQLIDQQKKADGMAKPGVKPSANSVVTHDRIPTLAEAGISKDLSSRAQKLAAVPHAEFEAEVSDWKGRVKAEGERVTTRLEKAGERAQGKTKAAKNAPTVESLTAEVEALRLELEAVQANAIELADMVHVQGVLSDGEQAAAKEIKRLMAELKTTASQRDAYMTKCNELIKTVNQWKRKAGTK